MNQKLAKVVIIGQANVGKSSLFNRIIKSKQAIVAREAGTTRDNVISRVSYNDFNFWLVDTAGLKNPEDDFEISIQDQIDEASNSADVIIVVVDACLMVSDKDRLIAKKALKTKKPVILVTNKCDLKNSLDQDEFRCLGIKDMIQASAEHNIGIKQILDTITSHLRPQAYQEEDDIIRVALIGRPNVGKSNLFNCLIGKQQAIVADLAGTTRDINRQRLRYHQTEIELLDTAGIRRPGKQEVGVEKFSILRTLQAIEESDICLFLMDVNQYNTQLDQRIAGLIKEAGKGLVIVITKWDSIEDKDSFTIETIAPKIAHTFDFIPWAPLIFTSSVTGQNVTKLFDLILDINKRRQQATRTRVLNDVLQDSVQKHPPAGLKNTQPKLRYIVQTDKNPPWFTFYGSNLKYLHWSYKRYLEKNIRSSYDYSGTPIKFSFIDEKQIKANRQQKGKDYEDYSSSR